MAKRRLFLEQRGQAHRHGKGGILETKTWQVMIDLEDEWPTVTCAQDLLDRLEPRRAIHDRRYAEEHKDAPRYGWESPDRTIWSDCIAWSSPQIVGYHLPSSLPAPRGLTEAEMKAQGARCGCHGSDDYCPCQNVPDAQTKAALANSGAP